jgi:hypothetical protein
MFKRCFNIGVLLVASVVLGATAMAQTSPSTPADSTSDCTVRTMNHFWLSDGPTNKEPSGFCVFSSNNEHIFIFFEGNIFTCSPSFGNTCRLSPHVPALPSDPRDTIAFIDGNLTIRDANGNLLFQTNTLGHPDAFLQVQDNGGIFMYDNKCNPLFTFFDPNNNTPHTCVLP